MKKAPSCTLEDAKEEGLCGTPGCELHDYHQGPCSCWRLPSDRRSAMSAAPPPPSRATSKEVLQGAAQASRSQQMMRSLGEHVERCGGTRDMVDGWHTRTEIRREGDTAGTTDTYFVSPSGKRFRSRPDVASYFELGAARSADAHLPYHKRLRRKTAPFLPGDVKAILSKWCHDNLAR